MGAHLLSLAELSPILLHLAAESSVSQLARTYLGRSLARRIQSLADEVQEMLGLGVGLDAQGIDDDIGDLSIYPGYAAAASEHRRRGERETGVQLWSRIDPMSAAPADPRLVAAEPDESPAHTALRRQVVALLSDLRQGLKIEARYRALPPDLDARLFAPLDASIRRRRDRLQRAERRDWLSEALEGFGEPPRAEEPSVGAGPIGG